VKTGADLEAALAHYRALAPQYDERTRRIDGIRLRTIERLKLRPGDVVLDAGCGTGWSLPHLARAVGATGRIIAFDPSAEMLEIARSRGGNAPVDLLRAPASEVRLAASADAALFSYTHDVIRSAAALRNVLGQLKPGARVAATSTKLYAPWLWPANAYLRWSHRAYITNFEGFEKPWSLLATMLDDFSVETGPFTQHYIATGRARAQAA
jgi:ubiquinone/menaquinone biosynthesis C-methylase UbiE